MRDARNGGLITFIPFAALLLFWEFVVRKDHWAEASSDGFFNFKKIVSVVLPVFLALWAITGIALTHKYRSERRELRKLASKDTTHFEARPINSPLVPVVVPKNVAKEAADEIRFSKLNKTISDVKNNRYDSNEYEHFLGELRKAYGDRGTVQSTPPWQPVP
jgi:hypothetical protein